MAANPEPSEAISVDELRSLETSVLKTLCLTINTAGSELKYKILDSLSDDDFYFPVLRAVFHTLSEMHLRGDYVISANLEEELATNAVDLPADFSIDQFFDGTLPTLSELTGWVLRLKERSRTGMIPTVKPATPPGRATPPPQAHATVVRSVEEVRQKIEEERRRSSPAVSKSPSSPAISAPPAAAAGPLERSSPAVEPPRARSQPRAASSPAVEPPPKRSASPSSPAASSPAVSSPAATPPPKRVSKAVLSSEGDDWASYLDELASKQGKTIETGFTALDEGLGGLGPGLMVLVDESQDRLFSFLKQLTDQIASKGEMRCLYLASRLTKAELRVRTLARLAAVSVADLEKGRLKKDSEDWRRVEQVGRSSGGWLRRVFVYEVQDELELGLARELVKKLLEAGDETSCFVVIDALECVARRGGSAAVVLSQLKALAESLDVLIVAGTGDPTVLSSRDADYAGVFRESQGRVELEVLQAGKESSALVAFDYDSAICRFDTT
jgi:hypothetical protein